MVQVEEVDREIRDLEALLEGKREQKRGLDAEVAVVDKTIDLVRAKFSEKIEKFSGQLVKISSKTQVNEKEHEENTSQKQDLADYEENWEERLKSMERELEEISQFSGLLKHQAKSIKNSLEDKEQLR